MIDTEPTRDSLLAEIAALRARVAELERAPGGPTRRESEPGAAPEPRPIDLEQEFCRVLLEHLPDGVVACNSEGSLILFNKTSRDWHGMDALKLPPQEWSSRYDLFDADGATPLATERIPLVRAFRGEHVRDAEMGIVARGQPPRFVRAAGAPILAPNGQQIGAVAIMHDVTTQRIAEEARRTSEAELRALFLAITDTIMVLDREGRCLKIAPTSPDTPGEITSEHIGRRLQDVLPEPISAALLARLREAIDDRKVVTMEYQRPTEGGDIWFLNTVSPLKDGTAFLVVRDITERKRVEEALRQSIQQEQIIRAQAVALAELSTPLIPINDDVVVMPLIGVLDSQRTQQIMTTLLAGVSERRARVAILDITGVSVVDTHVATGLLRAAQAAELLGSQVVLTGIRAEVAQSLVQIGADLGHIVTRGTLQSGIAYAMDAMGQRQR